MVSDNLSYSAKKRKKLKYRQVYFERNPGLLGCVWFCAYCGKPLFGKKSVEVDHIIPLNNFFGKNIAENLTSACLKCNRKKSDKADGRIIVGYTTKTLHSVLFSAQKIIYAILQVIIKIVFTSLEIIKNALIAPFSKTSLITKLIAIFFICYVIYYFLNYLDFIAL